MILCSANISPDYYYYYYFFFFLFSFFFFLFFFFFLPFLLVYRLFLFPMVSFILFSLSVRSLSFPSSPLFASSPLSSRLRYRKKKKEPNKSFLGKKKILPVAKKKKEKKKKKQRVNIDSRNRQAKTYVRNDKTEINMDGMIGKRPLPVDVQGAKRAGRAVNLDAAIGSLRKGGKRRYVLSCVSKRRCQNGASEAKVKFWEFEKCRSGSWRQGLSTPVSRYDGEMIG